MLHSLQPSHGAVNFILAQLYIGVHKTLLKQHRIEISMSKKGDCYDNALMESFFGTLKEECVERQKFSTRAEAKQVVFEYLEVFYNRQRKHSSLGYVSPSTYEKMKGEINIEKT